MLDLIGEIAAEEALQCSRCRVLAVEEPAGGEVLSLPAQRELLEGGEGPIRIVLRIAEVKTPMSAS